MPKFIHAADLHLDSPLRGLDRYEGAPVDAIRDATRRALVELVDLAIRESVDFLLVAGDIYDGDWRDFQTGLFFGSQMSRLGEANVRVFIIRGNHDAASRITRSLRLPEHVVELSTKRPETATLEDLGVAIHGQGFASQAVTEDLSQGYPDPISGFLNIGMLHTSVAGAEGHAPYAPCKLDELVSKGYDYWALGHVHTREILHRDPWIVFPGNTQGRHIRETGPKGCTLVDAPGGRIASVEHVDLDVLRWARCDVDAGGARDAAEALELTFAAIGREIEDAGGRPVAARVTITGTGGAHAELTADPEHWIAEIRAHATDMSDGSVWIEKVRLKTQAEVTLTPAQFTDGPLTGLLRSLEGDPDAGGHDIAADIDALMDGLRDLNQALPVEARKTQDGLDFDNVDTRREIMADVKQMLLAKLVGGGSGA
jgi:DNA repair exonuclease SbcCD nuclease subunit